MTVGLVIFAIFAIAALVAGLAMILLAGRRSVPAARDRQPTSHYAALRLAELDSDTAAGLLAPEEAAAERRLLLRLIAQDREATDEPQPRSGGLAVRLSVLAGVLIVAFAVYLAFGRPDLAMRLPAIPKAQPVAEQDPTAAEYAALLERLEQVLADHPDRVDGWRLLAKSRLDQGHAEEAFRAAQAGLARAPTDPMLLWIAGEALVRQAGGRVTPAAQLVFERLARARPDHPAPRYYRGLAALQAGQPDEALAIWRKLAASLDPQDPRRRQLAREIARVELMAAAGSGDPGAAIAGMVARLRTRLAQNPKDAEGWAMLARSYEVLGRPADALAALRKLAPLLEGPAREEVNAAIARLESQLADTGAGAGAESHETPPASPEEEP